MMYLTYVLYYAIFYFLLAIEGKAKEVIAIIKGPMTNLSLLWKQKAVHVIILKEMVIIFSRNESGTFHFAMYLTQLPQQVMASSFPTRISVCM